MVFVFPEFFGALLVGPFLLILALFKIIIAIITALFEIITTIIKWIFSLLTWHKAFTVLSLSMTTATMVDFIFIDYGRGVIQNYYEAVNWDRNTSAGHLDAPFKLRFMNFAESTCPDNKYRLTVNATPPTSRIRIMNIKPKYRPGICLTPRKYDIYVTHRDYHPYRKWIKTKPADVSLEVTLTPSF